MLSLTKCKKKLNKNGIFYTDKEVLMIRNVLYKFAEVYRNHMEKKLQIIVNQLNNKTLYAVLAYIL